MSITVPIAIYGWLPITLLIFAVLPPKKAALVSFVLAWLFLPMHSYRLPGLTSYGKMQATALGVMAGITIFDLGAFVRFKLSVFDLPIFLFCICPFFSSVSNGLGPYDGLSATLNHVVTWGIPYFVGKLYYGSLAGGKMVADAILLGGIIYVPLCLYEIRMSPQLHNMVYGYYQHSFAQTVRFNGFRPTVFMQHGLMVGLWMTVAFFTGLWMWWTGTKKEMWGTKMKWIVAALGVTAILCKSTGALALLVIAIGIMATTLWTGSNVVLWISAAIPPAYMFIRTKNLWTGRDLVTWTANYINEERAESLSIRLDQEDGVTALAVQRPLFGWGIWGYDAASGLDQLWLLIFRNHGLLGLVNMVLVMTVPVIIVCWKIPSKRFADPSFSASVTLAIISLIYLYDCLFNAMVNPIFTLAMGSVTGLGSLGKLQPTVAP